MNKYIIYADRRKFLVIAESEELAKIKFSKNMPSFKIRSIELTEEEVFNIIN